MKITLKSYDGIHYVCAENSGGQGIIANSTSAAQWETFEVIGPFVFGGRISLRTYDGKHYLSAINGGGQGIVADKTEAYQWESFKIIGHNGEKDGSPVKNGDKISFQTYDNIHFLCAENGGGREVIADRTLAKEWETFTVNIVEASLPISEARIIHISDLHFTNSSTTAEIDFDTDAGTAGGIIGGLLGGILGGVVGAVVGGTVVSGSLTDHQDSREKSRVISDYIINNAAQLGTKVIVITGDLTDSGDDEDYKIAQDFIHKLRSNGFAVFSNPGNHDYFKEGNIALGKSNERRNRFINYISNEYPHNSEYPYVISFGSCYLILLDSLQAIMDENTGYNFAQGKLGQKQLSKLKQLLAGYENERKVGKKIIVSLHHSPLKSIYENSKGGLDDCEEFFSIVSNKIDCLLFGHITPREISQISFPNAEYMYGIPIINCENLERMSSSYPITVVDMACHTIQVLPTDISQFPIVMNGKTAEGIHITPVVHKGDPVVYNYSDAAPLVKFKTGDMVEITVGGGVQTGGKGKTWKRYVNPSGDNSDKLYFGQINIPWITNGFKPIRNLIPMYGSYDIQSPDRCNLAFNIPNIDSIPESSRYLSLSYKDDAYGDNGYWGHDDGTEDQCKNIGSAYLDISIKCSQPSTGTSTDSGASNPKTNLQYNICPVVNKGIPITYNGTNGTQVIEFKKGDEVTIIAGGGVQTGGHGKTWKRYVNPSGPNSDKLYFGQIYIPGITSGLTPIRELVGKFGNYDNVSPDKCKLSFIIPNIDAIPQAGRFLSLGYKDDVYSDNGYWGHDDGTENQCKNVSNAYVYILIRR